MRGAVASKLLHQIGPKQMASSILRSTLVLSLFTLSALAAPAQPISPPPPPQYRVQLRYDIVAARDQHVARFDQMINRLEAIGFVLDPPLAKLPPTIRENPYINTLTGIIPSAKMLDILDVPSVTSALLIPDGFQIPQGPESRVQVQIELASGLGPASQKALNRQVVALLRLFDFDEKLGYDHRGYFGTAYTRVRGTIPWGKVDYLLNDLRGQPTGWFAPAIARTDLPFPLRGINPIRIVEVIRDPAPPAPFSPVVIEQGPNGKIQAELWRLIKDNQPHTKPFRVEIIMAHVPDSRNDGWRRAIAQRAPDLFVEGHLQNYVLGVFGTPFVSADHDLRTTPVLARDQIVALANLPFVSWVRLPPEPNRGVHPRIAAKGDLAEVRRKTGLVEAYQRGARGKGKTIAIVDSDFRGVEQLVQQMVLPASTRIIDLTTERNANLLPDPWKGNPQDVGHGTECAVATHLAAPDAQLVLVRIDDAGPYMMETALGYLTSKMQISDALARRQGELEAAAARLRLKRSQIMKERAVVFESFEDESEYMDLYGFLGMVRPWVFTQREWHFLRLAELEDEEKRFRFKELRLLQQFDEVKSLAKVDVVSCSLVWNDGYPLSGRSPISKLLSSALNRRVIQPRHCPPGHPATEDLPLWFQSSGNTGHQVWNGLYHDHDGNGVLEFLAPGLPLPSGAWTPELNFLAWQPFEGDRISEIPAGTKLHLSLQWTEPHDADYYSPLEPIDWYRTPLTEAKVTVLRQRDPTGKTLSQDDFEIIAETTTLPVRLDSFPDSATYELNLDFAVKQAGRYAVRIERKVANRWVVVTNEKTGQLSFIQETGLIPTGIRPLGAPTLTTLEPDWEFRPRLFVRAESVAGTESGRPVLDTVFTRLGELGLPGDARGVFSIGAASISGTPQPYSTAGPPPNLPLLRAPSFYMFDGIGLQDVVVGPAFGSGISTPFAAGTAAVLLSGGTTAEQLRAILHPPANEPPHLHDH